MSDNLKTIRELADELGVSKTAINKKVSDSERKQWFSKNGNRFLVNENGQKAIRIMFSSGIDNHKSKTENTYQQPESKTENFENANLKHSDINYLNDIIKSQNAQIEDLKETKSQHFKQLNQLQNLLDQQQRLALQDKQLLEEYKAEIKDLKALTMAPHDDGEKEVTSDKQPEPENSTPESQPKPKKWWRFGK
ncbi:DNA-binding protein [Leuconostoc mesenteroides]|uniref:DNA-binding protein n=1 Tax=Leuconostoc mesenteroides TaxID=1245 RepID=UPI001CC074E3|nr:DNA-binding protein [Leuconostoc mesenteroides]MBZ1519209.1 DNA-binding protein [Leuconostoc mesenteroides]MBZ1521457.1 DNA-binding protein [Leuconostoc mesenteroides]MBZ1523666.1 DNA-binding protein [Leuconostoc mesenteroides]MBZ1528178.1 DNA-binding protein [Leuconostoc mesenteroides]